MSNPIADGQVVQFHYTLTDDDGETIDTSRGDEPLAYIHGTESIVPGLERQLTGRVVGDTFVAVVPPADGYGEREEDGIARASRSEFPADVELEEGMAIVLEDDDGNEHPVWIAEVTDDEVVLDRNHPLAGITLHFDIEVTEVRDATAEEKEHGHVHGAGGHAH